MNGIPDKSVDMILCDLPYGTTKNKWDSAIPLDRLWKQYNRIIKENGIIILTSQGVFTSELIVSNKDDYRYTLIWEKDNITGHLNAKKQPLRRHEEILVFYKKQPIYNPQFTEGTAYSYSHYKYSTYSSNYSEQNGCERIKNEGRRYPTSIIKIKKPNPKQEKILHPTQKPVELFEYLIKTYTNSGGLVLDNCIGSGTTAIAAINTNRSYIGIELDENYFNIAEKRIKDYISAKVKN